MRITPRAVLLAAVSLVTLAVQPALAAGTGNVAVGTHADTADKAGEGDGRQPLPADAHIEQVTHVAGKTLNYTATVGSLPVRDEDSKKIAEVVFTAYTLDGLRNPDRPVTFVFQGGPGASSVFVNMGGIGPKHVQFGAEGDSPSDPPRLHDNPGTWLDFTDLVFIDPVGTGYSRSLVNQDEADKKFFTIKTDIAYLSRIVYDWLAKNGRMQSPKYVVGESYGGFRAPAIVHNLQTQMGVGVSGVVMVSPALDWRADADPDTSPMSWVHILPSMAAANYERQGKPLTSAQMADVENYASTEFVTDLLRGQRDLAAVERIVKRVAAYTGLDEAEVRHMGGRLDVDVFTRELYRDQGKLGSAYEVNVSGDDPYPWSPEQHGDPFVNKMLTPLTPAMVDFVTREVGWKIEAHYNAVNDETVYSHWEKDWEKKIESASDLRASLAIDPKMKALIVHGYNDLVTPYFPSKLIVAQIPTLGSPDRLQVKVYPGGHMFYARPQSQAALRQDAMALYGAH